MTVINWGNRGGHLASQAHIDNRNKLAVVKADLEEARPRVQRRIADEELVGKTHGNEKIDAIMLWLKIISRLNISSNSIDEDRVRIVICLQ